MSLLLLLVSLVLAVYTVVLNTTTVTETQVRGWLSDAGYQELTGLVRVDVVDAGLNVASTGCDGNFVAAQAVIQLTSPSLLSHPHITTSHEYGHVWADYHRCTYWQNSFDAYLIARGIYGQPWLDFTTAGCRNPSELMAHDYAQLFGNMDDGPSVIFFSCAQQEWQVGLKEPWNVPGFRDWYGLVFTQGHPPPGYSSTPATPTPQSATATPTPTPVATSTMGPVTPTPVVTCTPPRARRCR